MNDLLQLKGTFEQKKNSNRPGWSGDTNINAMDLYNKMTELIAELKGEN